jgi:hypothetical protein
MLLIVGPPRSGTTLVYQVAVRRLPVSYPTNLSALFPRAPITAQRAFLHRTSRSREAPRSYYGQTRRMADANDAFHLWDRWLGSQRYTGPGHIEPDAVAAMRRFFDAWHSVFPTPFVNKNNKNTDSLALLAAALPNARFLVVRRDPLETLQSLLVARRVVQGDASRAWGLRSRDADDNDALGPVAAVCDQLIEIEERLRADLATVDGARYLEVTYAQFCDDPDAVIEAAGALVGTRLLAAERSAPIARRRPTELSLPELEWAESRLRSTYDSVELPAPAKRG